MIESIQQIKNYVIYSFMEQINDKFFNVTFAIFDKKTVRVNILQYKDIYKKHLIKSINFGSINFLSIDSIFSGHEIDLKLAFEQALEEFSNIYKLWKKYIRNFQNLNL